MKMSLFGKGGAMHCLSKNVVCLVASLALIGCMLPASALGDPTDSSQDQNTSIVEPSGDEATEEDVTETPEEATPESDSVKQDDEGSGADESSKAGKKGKDSEKVTEKIKKGDSLPKGQLSKAQRSVQRMNEISTKLETAYEDLNQIQAKVRKVKKKVRAAKEDVEDASTDLSDAQEKLGAWVKESYINGPIRYLSVLLGATSFGDFASRVTLLDIITESEANAVQRVSELQAKFNVKSNELSKALAKQKSLQAQAKENTETIEDSLLSQVEYFSSLNAKVRAKVLKSAGGSAIVARAAMGGSTSKKGSHPEVVKLALTFLGIDYVWGGETPWDGFDCSGLVLYCYREACGINLTHFARTQYSEGKHIARSALMPGDLVFFGPNVAGIHHVGIYMGKDKFIQAPQTGDVVKISKLSDRTDYVGACRP